MSAWQGTARAPLAAPNTTSLALLTDYMNSVLTVDSARHRLRVQAGMLVTKLMKEAANLNMSLPLGSIPAFADLTLGGVLSTGAHGSGLNTTSSLVRKGCPLITSDSSPQNRSGVLGCGRGRYR